MKIIWTREAYQDRIDIWDYIASENPHAANELDDLIDHAASQLRDSPQMGHHGIIAGTRELLPHKNYRLIYEIHDHSIWILAIVHSARQWPLNTEASP